MDRQGSGMKVAMREEERELKEAISGEGQKSRLKEGLHKED